MRFDAIIYLLTVTYEQDDILQQVAKTTSRQVFANEFTISSAEYYDAGRSGLKPEVQYEIRSFEYAGETLLSSEDVEYDIIRTGRRGEWTILTCQRRVGTIPAGDVS